MMLNFRFTPLYRNRIYQYLDYAVISSIINFYFIQRISFLLRRVSTVRSILINQLLWCTLNLSAELNQGSENHANRFASSPKYTHERKHTQTQNTQSLFAILIIFYFIIFIESCVINFMHKAPKNAGGPRTCCGNHRPLKQKILMYFFSSKMGI